MLVAASIFVMNTGLSCEHNVNIMYGLLEEYSGVMVFTNFIFLNVYILQKTNDFFNSPFFLSSLKGCSLEMGLGWASSSLFI